MTNMGFRFMMCLTLVFANMPVAMADPDWRFSAGLGRASAQFDNSPIAGADIEDSDTSLHLSLSYEVVDRLYVSLGYLELGEGELRFTADTTDPDALQAANSDIAPVLGDGVSLSLEYDFYSVNQFHFSAEIGLFDWEAEIDSLTISDSPSSSRLNTVLDGTDVLLGLGTRYRLSETFEGYLKATRYNLEPNKVNELHVGLIYVF